MFYVHKLYNTGLESKLKNCDFEKFNATFLHQEFKAIGNTISFWHVESLDKIEESDAIKALLLTQNRFSKNLFIVIDKNDIKNYDLKVKKSDGKTGYKKNQKLQLHRDIHDLKVSSIKNLFNLYKENIQKDNYHFLISQEEMEKEVFDLFVKDEIDFKEILDDLSIRIFRLIFSNDNRVKGKEAKIDLAKKLVYEISIYKPYYLVEILDDFFSNFFDKEIFFYLLKAAFYGLSKNCAIDKDLFDAPLLLSKFENNNLTEIINLLIYLSTKREDLELIELLDKIKNSDFSSI